jgi:hypothetical protein
MILNSVLNRNDDNSKQFTFSFSHSGGKSVIADFIRWEASADYERQKTENFSLHDVQYMNSTTPRDYINNYLDNASHQWKLHGNLSYSLGWPHQDIMLDYDYHYIYNKTDNMLYRLDKLTDIDSTFFTLLPSAREALAGVMDRNNSYQYREYQNHHQFLLKFDREDIGELALAMDDVVDHMEAATLRLDLFNVREMRPAAVELAELTLTAVHDMQEMIEHLPDYKRDDMVMKKAIAVGHVEDGGDEVYENALRALFREDETRGKESLAWLRLYDRMEHCLDACDHAAGVVRNVVLKAS